MPNTTGAINVATGLKALFSNTTGESNVATGYSALGATPMGTRTSPPASSALGSEHDRQRQRRHRRRRAGSNTTGNNNVATGVNALLANTTGNNNVASGPSALLLNTTGSANVAIGRNAGQEPDHRLQQRRHRQRRQAGEAGTIRIGTNDTQTATYIAGISGTTLGGAPAGGRQRNGQLGIAPAAVGVRGVARGDRRAAAAPGRPASRAGEGRLIEAVLRTERPRRLRPATARATLPAWGVSGGSIES